MKKKGKTNQGVRWNPTLTEEKIIVSDEEENEEGRRGNVSIKEPMKPVEAETLTEA